MNNVTIKLNPYKDWNVSSINGNPISIYSALNNYMREPFLQWAGNLLSTIEDELNDDYSLTVIGEKFEKMFLLGIQNDNDACLQYTAEDYSLNQPVMKRLSILKPIAQKHNITLNPSQYILPVYFEEGAEITVQNIRQVSAEDAFLSVIVSGQTPKFSANSPKIILIPSEQNRVTCQGNVYFWEVEKDRLTEYAAAIVERYTLIPYLVDLADALRSIADDLTDDERSICRLALEIDAFISVPQIESIEVGKSVTIYFKSIPEWKSANDVLIESSDPAIISVNGTEITANSAGSATLRFYRQGENTPFEKRTVSAYCNNSVKRIELLVSNCTMGVGKKQKIDVSVFPTDAEDAGKVNWKVSSDLAEITSEGELCARGQGNVTVTAFTKNASCSLEIQILPNIEKISLTKSRISNFVGQTEPIAVAVFPQNCFDKSVEWKTSDKYVAVVEQQDDGSFVVRSTGIGTCTITCVAVEGGMSAICNVTVDSTFNRKSKSNSAEKTMFGFWLAALLVSVIGYNPIPTIVLSIVAIWFGGKARKAKSVFSVFVMLFSVGLIVTSVISLLKG